MNNPYKAFSPLMCLQEAFLIVFPKNVAWSITYLACGVYFGTLYYHSKLKTN